MRLVRVLVFNEGPQLCEGFLENGFLKDPCIWLGWVVMDRGCRMECWTERDDEPPRELKGCLFHCQLQRLPFASA